MKCESAREIMSIPSICKTIKLYKKTCKKISSYYRKSNVIFYQFSPDSIFNLTQDAEGDATVFDMNGDLLTTDIKITDKDGKDTTRGMFYSIVAQQEKTAA